jgi:hypothetical protein
VKSTKGIEGNPVLLPAIQISSLFTANLSFEECPFSPNSDVRMTEGTDRFIKDVGAIKLLEKFYKNVLEVPYIISNAFWSF